MKTARIAAMAMAVLLATALAIGCKSDPPAESGLTSMPLPQALTNGKPTIAEFGRGTCIPCKEMKPILEELATAYEGRVNVVIISVDDYQALTSHFKINVIPTQVVFDSEGKEVGRHVGLWPEAEVVAQIKQMGVK